MTPKFIFPTYGNTHFDSFFYFGKAFIFLLSPITMEIGLKLNTSILRQVLSERGQEEVLREEESFNIFPLRVLYYDINNVLWHCMKLSPPPSFQIGQSWPLWLFQSWMLHCRAMIITYMKICNKNWRKKREKID